MTKPTRGHVGCGTVYLDPADGWTNIDLPFAGLFLAADRPDLVERYVTTEDRGYYARHQDKTAATLAAGPVTKDAVCDVFGGFDRLPFGIGEATEILARHSFEHLSLSEARRALDEIDRVLAPGGILRLDVPDHDESLRAYADARDDDQRAFYKRHLLGARRNDYGFHMMSYSRERLRALVEDYGFVFEAEELPNIHFYPAFTLRWRKPPVPLPRDYAFARSSVIIPSDASVLDIGPGRYPLQRANAYMDVDEENARRIEAETGKSCYIGDLDGKLPFRDKQWDWLYCSHALEHVLDPVHACRELSRVSRAGLIVTPHAFKDGLFLWEEGTHRWSVFPPKRPDGPIGFMPLDYELRSKVADSNIQSVMCRLMRTGPNRLDADSRAARKWFARVEPDLDIVVAWEGRVEAEIISW